MHHLTSLINDGIKRSKQIGINTLWIVNYDTTTDSKQLPYMSTYNPRNNEPFNIIIQNFPILTGDKTIKLIFETHKIIKQPNSSKKY